VSFTPLGLSSLRHLSTTTRNNGIFSSFSKSAATPAPPPPSTDHDAPLTPFQSQIAALETEALAEPEDLEKQLVLLRALLAGGEFVGITKYYDAMAMTTEGHGSKALLESGEALNLYLEALGKIGRMQDIAGAVRRRDTLRGSGVSTATESPSPSVSAASGPSSVLSGVISPGSTSTSSTSSPIAAQAGSTQPGTPLAPIYVQMAPATPQMSAMRALRWLLGMLFWAFIILTIMSMVMENTGLMKAGPGPAEFEPEEGKVVKFSDVHGVEEAKSVSRAPSSPNRSDKSRNWKKSSNSSRTQKSFLL
jgi:ATP-dependent metalloprotease